MTAFPKRKANRLKGFDYSTPTAYFLTLCTQHRQCLLSTIVGASIARPPRLDLTPVGTIVDSALQSISVHYCNVQIEKYVIMPNHIHLILHIFPDADGRAMLAPTVSRIIQHFKGTVTKHLGTSIWQKSFHDHIIRTEQDYRLIWEYIDTNPSCWEADCFYQP